MANNLISNNMRLAVAAIVIVGVAIPLTTSVIVTDVEPNTENFTSSGSLPETFALSTVQEGVKEGSETLTYINTTGDGSETELTDANSNVTWDYETGEFTVEDLDSTMTSSLDSGDEFSASYDYKPVGYVSGILAVMLPFVVVGMAVGLLMSTFKDFL